MKIEKYTKLKGNKYSVKIDDLVIKLYDDVIVKFELIRKKEIDEKEFKSIVSYNDKLEAYYKALKYITKKLRTEKEIFKYLEKDYSLSVVKETIDKLKSNGYINSELYLKCYLSDQINLGVNGPNRIKKDLVKLGYQEDEINGFIDDVLDEVWFSKIEKIVNKRINGNKSYGNNKLKEKLVYDLSNMGYYKWMIDEILLNSEFKDNSNLIEKEYNKIVNKLSKKYEGYELQNRVVAKLLSKGFSYDEIKKYM